MDSYTMDRLYEQPVSNVSRMVSWRRCLWCVSIFFFSSRRRHTRYIGDWSSDVCSSDLGASEMVLAIEALAKGRGDAVGTVGEIAVRPGAKNVVPGECVFSLDLRAARGLDDLVRDVRGAIRRISDARRLTSSIDVLTNVPAAPLDAGMRDLMRR